MPQHIEISVIGADFEALIADAVPLVQNLLHFICTGLDSEGSEAERALVGFESGVTLNL